MLFQILLFVYDDCFLLIWLTASAGWSFGSSLDVTVGGVSIANA